MAINPLDIVAGRYTPQSRNIMEPYLQGQQMAGMAGLRSLAGQKFAGKDISKGSLLAQLSQVDPMEAMKASGEFTFGKAKGERKKSVFELRQAAMSSEGAEGIMKSYNDKLRSSGADLAKDPKMNITEVLNELAALNNKYFAITQKSLPGAKDLRGTLSRVAKMISTRMGEEKFGFEKEKQARKVSEEDEADMKEDVKNVTSSLQKYSELVQLANKAKSFASEALKGNPVASKNIIAATSRLGSNEALSDQELPLILTGRVDEVLEKKWNELFKTGAKIDEASVKHAISQIDDLKAKWTKNLQNKVKKVITRLQKANPKYTEEDIENRLLMVIGEAEQAPAGRFGKY